MEPAVADFAAICERVQTVVYIACFFVFDSYRAVGVYRKSETTLRIESEFTVERASKLVKVHTVVHNTAFDHTPFVPTVRPKARSSVIVRAGKSPPRFATSCKPPLDINSRPRFCSLSRACKKTTAFWCVPPTTPQPTQAANLASPTRHALMRSRTQRRHATDRRVRRLCPP